MIATTIGSTSWCIRRASSIRPSSSSTARASPRRQPGLPGRRPPGRRRRRALRCRRRWGTRPRGPPRAGPRGPHLVRDRLRSRSRLTVLVILDSLVNIALLLAILVALVVVHEFGHFVVARRAGVEGHEFGIGFPPPAPGADPPPRR